MEVDLSQLSAELRAKVDEVLRRDFDLLVLKALERQRRIAFENWLRRPMAQDGFGELTMQVDPVFDAMWRSYYGHDYSDNPDLVRFLKRRNPEIVVRSRGTRIQVGYGTCGESRRPVGMGSSDQ